MTIHPLVLSLLATSPLLGSPSSPASVTVAPEPASSAQPAHSMLVTVPDDAYGLVHCRAFGALRERAKRNDWFRLLESHHGDPFRADLEREFRTGTHRELDELLLMAAELEGEVVLFDTGAVAGFVAEPPADGEALAGLMAAWMPNGDPAARQTLDIAGGRVELFAWPDEIDGWSGRAGHVAALVVHPWALAIYSGDDGKSVLAALSEGLARLGTEQHAPVVSAYLAAGGGASGGMETFVDFTPYIADAEAAMKRAFEGALPDPSRLLGLEAGTWFHASADLFPGTRVDCRARLHVPGDTLAAQLADTFQPLPRTLPADLPKNLWSLWALNWDLGSFYGRMRAAYEAAERGDELTAVDAAIGMSQGMTGIDPIVDVLGQLAGDVAWYFARPDSGEQGDLRREFDDFLSLGLHVGLRDGAAFQEAFEKLLDVGGLASVLELDVIQGVDVYLMEETDVDGGVAFLPRAMTAAPSRSVLERSLRALTQVAEASLDGSRMQAALDENAGACFLTFVEMSALRAFAFSDVEGDLLPATEPGVPARDPFDSELISTAHRTADGFEFALQTR